MTDVVMIQNAWRCNSSRFELRWRMLKREHEEKVQKRMQAATLIQKNYQKSQAVRGARTRRKILQEERAILVESHSLPKLVEDVIPDDEDTQVVSPEVISAEKIQRAYRSYNSRLYLRWKREAREELLQKVLRREHQQQLLIVSDILTRIAHGYLYRLQLFQYKLNNEKLQLEASELLERQTKSAIAIQRAWRCKWSRDVVDFMKLEKRMAKRRLREKLRTPSFYADCKHLHDAALIIQRTWRGFVSRRYATLFRERRAIAEEKARIQQQAIHRMKVSRVTDIQRVYRGYYCRCSTNILFSDRRSIIASSHITETAEVSATAIQKHVRRLLSTFNVVYIKYLRGEELEAQLLEERKAAARIVIAAFVVKQKKSKRDRKSKRLER